MPAYRARSTSARRARAPDPAAIKRAAMPQVTTATMTPAMIAAAAAVAAAASARAAGTVARDRACSIPLPAADRATRAAARACHRWWVVVPAAPAAWDRPDRPDAQAAPAAV